MKQIRKIRVWGERSGPIASWTWRYGVIISPTEIVPAGTAPRWQEAMTRAEYLVYADHHALPRKTTV